MQQRVVAVILNWNSCADTLACLASLQQQTYEDLSTIVVDNGSYDGCVEAVRRGFPSVCTLQLDENRGYIGGNNAGIRCAVEMGADCVLIVNPDVRLAVRTVEYLVRAVEPCAAAVGPTVYYMDEPTRVQSAGCLFNRRTGASSILTTFGGHRPREVDYVSGCAIMLSRAALDEIGLFDDRYFSYAEELEWCLRAQSVGFRILHVPDARAWHRWGSTAPAALEQFLVSRNHVWLIMKHCPIPWKPMALGMLIFVRVPRRALAALRIGSHQAAVGAIKGVLWHVGLFTSRNPLTAVTSGRMRRAP